MIGATSFYRVGVLLGTILMIANCAQTSAQSSNSLVPNAYAAIAGDELRPVSQLPLPTHGTAQLISANDVLEMEIYKVPDLKRVVEVDRDGNISLPLISTLPASGRTLRALEFEIAREYSLKHLENPQVSLLMRQSSGQRVTIDGEVEKAGIYPLDSNSTLVQVIAQAGSLSRLGNPRQLLVFRQIDGVRYVASYDLTAIRAGKASNPPILGGDMIIVPHSASRAMRADLRDLLDVTGRLGSLALLAL